MEEVIGPISIIDVFNVVQFNVVIFEKFDEPVFVNDVHVKPPQFTLAKFDWPVFVNDVHVTLFKLEDPVFVNDVQFTLFKVDVPVLVNYDKFAFWLHCIIPLNVHKPVPDVNFLLLLINKSQLLIIPPDPLFIVPVEFWLISPLFIIKPLFKVGVELHVNIFVELVPITVSPPTDNDWFIDKLPALVILDIIIVNYILFFI